MESIPPLVVWNGKPKLSAWQLASLDILGVDVVHRTTKSSGVVRVKEAIWFYRESGHTPSLLLQALRTRALKAISTPYHAGKKIYIKRRTHRSASNDDAVERLLTNLGYETICTEDLLQADQIALFSGAQSVVAIHGAGLANMLFMPPGATVIELTPHVAVRPFYWIMAQKLKHRYGVLMCNAVEGRFDGRIEVNLSDLSRLIAKMDPDAGPSCRPSGDDPGLGGGRP
jgi:capsular polysaccharide biosynthesis protein